MLTVNHISFAYNNTKVINSIDFRLAKGNILCLLGKSGCGKSTLIKLIYGLHDLDEGSISWNEQLILGPKYNLIPDPSFMKYLAQDFNLMPYSTVEENVGLALSNSEPEKKKKRIRDLLDTVEMIDFLHVKAQYLSGGQQQRVALAKALANEPEILLLDEPFSQIDLFKKNTLSRNLFTYLKKKKITCIFATHDSMDALSFADTVIIMKNGKILTQNHPTTLYKTPKNHYIASLFEEVNNIPIQHFIPWYEEPEKKILIYASELYPIEKSNFKVRVKKNYFKGSHYLIEAQLKHQAIFFTHTSPITEKETVYLTTSENTLLNRL